MKSKLILIPTLVLAGLLVYSQSAKAFSGSSPRRQELISALAQKLGISEDKVDSALTEVREQMRAEHELAMQQSFEERLQSLVDEGKLTEGQREAWIAKHEEMLADRNAYREEHHDEMVNWANENGIDLSVIGPMGLGGRMDGRGMHGMHGDWQ